MTTHHKHTSLKELHTFRLPYSAQALIELTCANDLAELNDDYYVLGEGSNTIFTEDFSYPVLRVAIEGYEQTSTEQGYELRVGAGENWHALVVRTLSAGMPGLENLALIPGSVGAAPVQNIGAYGVEVAEYVRSVEAWDRQARKFVVFTAEECQFAYRDSLFKKRPGRYVITYVNLLLPKQWQPRVSYGALSELGAEASANAIMEAVIRIRNSKLPNPKELPNAGSFFKNPIVSRGDLKRLLTIYPALPYFSVDTQHVKLAAGWMIDYLGLKGFSVGDAAVHDKQALVLVNKGSACGTELLSLAKAVQARVAKEFSVALEVEVRLLNDKELINV